VGGKYKKVVCIEFFVSGSYLALLLKNKMPLIVITLPMTYIMCHDGMIGTCMKEVNCYCSYVNFM
jgi:hypothetical protein